MISGKTYSISDCQKSILATESIFEALDQLELCFISCYFMIPFTESFSIFRSACF